MRRGKINSKVYPHLQQVGHRMREREGMRAALGRDDGGGGAWRHWHFLTTYTREKRRTGLGGVKSNRLSKSAGCNGAHCQCRRSQKFHLSSSLGPL